MLRCKPSPNETLASKTGTPTMTPIEVSVARSLASRRFLKASRSRSKKGISKCSLKVPDRLAYCVACQKPDRQGGHVDDRPSRTVGILTRLTRLTPRIVFQKFVRKVLFDATQIQISVSKYCPRQNARRSY